MKRFAYIKGETTRKDCLFHGSNGTLMSIYEAISSNSSGERQFIVMFTGGKSDPQGASRDKGYPKEQEVSKAQG
jgi:hypothetical protein